MSNKNFYIMVKNEKAAKWENGNLTILNESLLPLFLRRISNADMWLETRAIDSHRANSRLLKKALGLTERDDFSTAFYVNGATITDAKWSTPQILIDHFANKKIVVPGDSISTLAGETPSGYAVYYTSDKMNTYAIGKNTTWWGSFINNVKRIID